MHRIPDPQQCLTDIQLAAHLEDDDQERGERFDNTELESALFAESDTKKNKDEDNY